MRVLAVSPTRHCGVPGCARRTPSGALLGARVLRGQLQLNEHHVIPNTKGECQRRAA